MSQPKLFLIALCSFLCPGHASQVRASLLSPLEAGCAELKNKGTHFTIDVEVGTSPQVFSVVADTGSDSVIVPSCVCRERGVCNKHDRCFVGTNRSSSFFLQHGPNGPNTVMITFGSGPIQAVIASDMVQVGGIKTRMNDSVLLMVNHQLNIPGPFEGILGLGIPKNESLTRPSPAAKMKRNMDPSAHTVNQQNHDIIQKIMGGAGMLEGGMTGAGMPISEAVGFPFPGASQGLPMNVQHSEDTSIPSIQSMDISTDFEGNKTGNSRGTEESMLFLQHAGVDRFSMCFNDGASGVLRLGTPKQQNMMGSVGKFHWGLGLNGMSVGSADTPVTFCSPANMTRPGQKTPCGAIPDSGTTLLTGPADQIMILFDDICDKWDRCINNYTALSAAADAAKKAAEKEYSWNPFDIKTPRKSDAFNLLLSDCDRWLTKSQGLRELPSLHLHLTGSENRSQTIELTGWAYVIESRIAVSNETLFEKMGMPKPPDRICRPAFGPMDYNTMENGPVWILGTSLFYEHRVEYDLSSQPPSIGFSSLKDDPCGSCSKDASLVSQSRVRTPFHVEHARPPRKVYGPVRTPSIDITQPF